MYIISRHFKSDERISSLLITISNEICNKVESLLSIKTIFSVINDKENCVSDEEHLENIKQKIIQGSKIL